MKKYLLLSLALLLGGCATSNVPEGIRAPVAGPSVPEVRTAPQRFVGSTVRWGGTIAEVDNRPEETLIQVVARELNDEGKPQTEDRSEGRFIARVAGFVDPAVYSEGRRITIVGAITGSRVVEVGEYPYRFPVVSVESYYLWPPEPQRAYGPRYYDPFWYDPWYPYHPYRPYGPWPYYW